MKETIGKRIKRLRKEQKLTQFQACNECRLTQAAWSRLENDQTEPTLQTAKLIADMFNTTIDYIVTGVNTHYCVITEYSYRGAKSQYIVGIYHSIEEAQKALRKKVEEEDRPQVVEDNYTIYEDTPTRFDAGLDEQYDWDHVTTYVVEVD